MSFTYDKSKLDQSLYRIRLELGDTDSDRPLLQDEEINLSISLHSGLHKQVVHCCELIIARFSSKFKRTMENYAEDPTSIVKFFTSLAEKHSSKGGYPWVGGISKEEKTDIEDDTDLTKPFFTRGINDNPKSGSTESD